MNKKINEESSEWTSECENLLAEWSEKSSCYRWLHGRSEKKYRKQYYSFSIPVIILSTLTGAANVGMDSFVPTEHKPLASAIVGGVNIIAGIVSTLQNFLKVAELMEAHRIAGVSWGKIGRNISIELSLDPLRRVSQSDFLKLSRSEYDRLIEAGPIIDDDIIRQFNKKFTNYKISIPSVCNGLDKCTVYRVEKRTDINEDYTDGIEDIIVKGELTNRISNINDMPNVFNGVSNDAPNNVSNDAPNNVSNDAPNNVSNDAPNNVSNDAPNNVSNDALNDKNIQINMNDTIDVDENNSDKDSTDGKAEFLNGINP